MFAAVMIRSAAQRHFTFPLDVKSASCPSQQAQRGEHQKKVLISKLQHRGLLLPGDSVFTFLFLQSSIFPPHHQIQHVSLEWSGAEPQKPPLGPERAAAASFFSSSSSLHFISCSLIDSQCDEGTVSSEGERGMERRGK